jgi:6-pyruvoyltetrahydropterin/6-carboxytetrahydropterin synthase
VLDFGDLKRIVKENILDVFDHVLALNETDPRKESMSLIETKLILTSYQPTAENLMVDFVHRIKDKLPPEVTLHSLKLRETSTSFVEWFSSDN